MGPIRRLLEREMVFDAARLCNVATALAVSTGTLAACAGAATPAAEEVVHATEAPTFGTTADDWPAARVRLTDPDGEVHVLAVRVAEEPGQRRQGLMGVEEVPPGTGMIFVWDGAEREGGFWMKDTLVPLDIAYIRSGKVVDVQRMEPCVDYEDASRDCPGYPPAAAYDTALEVPAGWFAEHDIDVGSEVELTR